MQKNWFNIMESWLETVQKANEKRDEFYSLAAEMPINKALNQVAPITIKDYAIEKAKKFLYSTGTIKYIRKLKKKHTIAVTK